MKKRLIIIGGGISGMSLAFLSYNNYDVTLIEAKDRLGGKIYGTFENNHYKEHSLRTFHTTYIALKYIMKQLESPINNEKNLWDELNPTQSDNYLSFYDKIKLYYKFFILTESEIEDLKKISFIDWLEKNYKDKKNIDRIISNVGIWVAARSYSSAYEIYTMIVLGAVGKTLQPTFNYNNFIIDPLEKHIEKYISIKKNTKVNELIYNNKNTIKSIKLNNDEILEGDIFIIATYKNDMYKLYNIEDKEKLRWHSEISCSFQIVLDNKKNNLGILKNNYNLIELSPWHVVWYPYCNKTWIEEKYFKDNPDIVIFSIVVSDINKKGDKIKKKLVDCSKEEVLTELLFQIKYDEDLIKRLAIPDKEGNIIRLGNNINYNNGNWTFSDPLTINLPNKESLNANTKINNLFISGEHVKSHIWQVPTMEQACESSFECFKEIEKSEGRTFIIPYDKNFNNILPQYIKTIRSLYLFFNKKSRGIKKKFNVVYLIIFIIFNTIIILLKN